MNKMRQASSMRPAALGLTTLLFFVPGCSEKPQEDFSLPSKENLYEYSIAVARRARSLAPRERVATETYASQSRLLTTLDPEGVTPDRMLRRAGAGESPRWCTAPGVGEPPPGDGMAPFLRSPFLQKQN